MRTCKSKKLLQLMVIAALLCTSAGWASAQNSYTFVPQKVKHKSSDDGYPQPDTRSDKLVNVLKDLNKTKGVYFMFSSHLGEKVVNKVNDLSENVEALLEKILKNTGLTYKKVNANTFVILSAKDTDKTSPGSQELSFSNMITIEPLPNNVIEAPDNTITGKVTDKDGNPVENVSVTVKGKTTGTSTNSQGLFSISANKGDVLLFTSIGYESKEVVIGPSDNIEVTLLESSKQLNEVVVTALGISRQKKSLTYSVQTVDNSALNNVKDANLVNNLTGRVAGVNITRSSSGIGGSVRVVIRGNKSTRE
ncbi:MAG TPA: carboxypeptidase-like regulatory domain-containing protein, partial [Chitinophagaceae bacterium]|nr:carboxypeptidase-like regulatory domain-containing protein [Chitinophagaceae bacterium]